MAIQTNLTKAKIKIYNMNTKMQQNQKNKHNYVTASKQGGAAKIQARNVTIIIWEKSEEWQQWHMVIM